MCICIHTCMCMHLTLHMWSDAISTFRHAHSCRINCLHASSSLCLSTLSGPVIHRCCVCILLCNVLISGLGAGYPSSRPRAGEAARSGHCESDRQNNLCRHHHNQSHVTRHKRGDRHCECWCTYWTHAHTFRQAVF